MLTRNNLNLVSPFTFPLTENIIIGWAEGSRNPFLTITTGAKRKAGNAAQLHALGVPTAKSGNLLLNDDNDVRPSPAFKALEQFLGEKQESNATSTETQIVTIWVSPLCTHCPNYIQMAGKPLCKPRRQALERRAIKDAREVAVARRAQKRSPSPSPPPPPLCPIGHRAQQNSDSDTDTDAGSLAGNDQMDSEGTDTDREQPGDEDQHATQIKKERSAASKAAVEIENAELKCQQKTTIKQNADLRVQNDDLVAQNAVLVAQIAGLVQGKRKMEEEEEDRIERIVKARLSERMPSTRTSRQLKKEELKVRQQSLESLADADGDSSDDDSDDLPQPPNLKRSQSV